MDWLQIFVQLILTGILLYVFQRVIDERAERRLEEFKSDLRKDAFEKEIKFSKLHENRFPILLETHKKMLRVNSNLNKMYLELQDLQLSDDFLKISNDFNESSDAFYAYFQQNQLYLPDKLYDQLFKFYVNALSASSKLSATYMNYDYSRVTNEGVGIHNEFFNKNLRMSLTIMEEKLYPVLRELENEFRQLIGTDNKSS